MTIISDALHCNGNSIFRIDYNGVVLDSVAQPIVANDSKEIYSFELLSRCKLVDSIDVLFSAFSPTDISSISCLQIKAINTIFPRRKRPFNINIGLTTLVNSDFLDLIKSGVGMPIIFEVSVFDREHYTESDLIKAFRIVQSYGYQVWLDDFGAGNSTLSILMAYPWDGVKIDKEILWGGEQKLQHIVALCNNFTSNITVEGVETKYLESLSAQSGATLSQGFYWSMLDRKAINSLL